MIFTVALSIISQTPLSLELLILIADYDIDLPNSLDDFYGDNRMSKGSNFMLDYQNFFPDDSCYITLNMLGIENWRIFISPVEYTRWYLHFKEISV